MQLIINLSLKETVKSIRVGAGWRRGGLIVLLPLKPVHKPLSSPFPYPLRTADELEQLALFLHHSVNFFDSADKATAVVQ